MLNLMFLALSPLSKGDMTIAVEFARQLPTDKYNVCFMVTEENQAYIEQRGLFGVSIGRISPQSNATRFHELVAEFRPHYFIAADVYTLEFSQVWSGIGFHAIHEQYPIPFITFDQYEWISTNYMLDFYGHNVRIFPPLIEKCDMAIRNCPLNKPLPATPGAATVRLYSADQLKRWCGSDGNAGSAWQHGRHKVVFFVNSKWEYINIIDGESPEQTMTWMPHIIHNHLAALKQPLTLVHVGPVAWDFPIADHLRYCYYNSLTPASFDQALLSSDLFITTNIVSITLSKAVCNGVPSIVFQNDRILDFRELKQSGQKLPEWLASLAQEVDVVYPFRMFPWGLFDFLAPVLTDNPYTGCFVDLPLFQRKRVLQTLETLLYDRSAVSDLQCRQLAYVEQMLQLPSPEEVFEVIESTVPVGAGVKG